MVPTHSRLKLKLASTTNKSKIGNNKIKKKDSLSNSKLRMLKRKNHKLAPLLYRWFKIKFSGRSTLLNLNPKQSMLKKWIKKGKLIQLLWEWFKMTFLEEVTVHLREDDLHLKKHQKTRKLSLKNLFKLNNKKRKLSKIILEIVLLLTSWLRLFNLLVIINNRKWYKM